jgi:hypothetical protein
MGFGLREAFAAAAPGAHGAIHLNTHPRRQNGPRPSKPSGNVNLKMGPCTITRQGEREVRTFTSTTTTGGHSVTILERRIKGPDQTQHNTRVEIDGKLQYLVARRKANKGSTITGPVLEITAGPAFGVRGMHLTSADGKTLNGKINGRQIAPWDVSGKIAAPQFADGKPAPKAKVMPGLEQTLQTAFKKAGQDIKLCVGSQPGIQPFGHPKNGPIAAIGADAGYSKGCQTCLNDCYSGFNDCEWKTTTACAASAAACLFAYPACLAACEGIGLNTCGNNQNSCEDKCAYSFACCPIACDNHPPSNGPGLCCSAGLKCVDATDGWCCPPGYKGACASGYCSCCPPFQPVCGSQCCEVGQGCTEETICCPITKLGTPPVSCGGNCCGAGQTCVQGPTQAKACCPINQVYDGGKQCCDGPVKNGKCCVGTWCGEKCCPYGCDANGKCKPNPLCLTGQWVNGKCCPQNKLCRDGCCEGDSYCVDQSGGTCATPPCSSGQSLCLSMDKYDRYTAMCCKGSNSTCCNGQCCKSGEICCKNGKGVLGCNPMSACPGEVIK